MNQSVLKYLLLELHKSDSFDFIIVSKKKELLFPNNLNIAQDFIDYDLLKYAEEKKINIIEKDSHFFSIFFCDKTIFNGSYLIVGPTTIPDEMLNYTSLNNRSPKPLESLLKANEHFFNFVNILYSIVNNSIPLENVERDIIITSEHNFGFRKLLKHNLNIRRTEDQNLDSIEFERRYIEAVRNNQVDKIDWMINKMSAVYFVSLSSENLKSLKYKFVSLISIFTRMSINYGVSTLTAYSLSDSLIQKLESIRTIQECIVHFREGSILFMKLIHTRYVFDGNETVKSLAHYIDTHLYNELSLSDLSDYVNRSKTYISKEFKKVTGTTLHNYIIKQKINESKHLLLFTDLSQSQIASILNFSNQSHYIKIFKNLEGVTPDKFKSIFQSKVKIY